MEGASEEGGEASPGKLAITSGTPASWMEQVDIRWDYTVKESKFQVRYARSHLCRLPCFKFLKLLVRLFLDTERLDFDLLSLFLSRILLLLPLLLCCERHRASTRGLSGHSVHQVFTVNPPLLDVRLVRISSPPIDLRISSVIPHS